MKREHRPNQCAWYAQIYTELLDVALDHAAAEGHRVQECTWNDVVLP